jgi:negative regulator of genetic competence, sporulation and motility
MRKKLDKNKNSNAESKKGDDFYQMIATFNNISDILWW